MGRLFVAALAVVVIPNLAWADGADSSPAPSSAGPAAAKAPALPPIQAELKSNKQKGSFSIGYSMGMTLRKQVGTENIDPAAFLLGMQEALAGQKATLSAIEQEKAAQGPGGRAAEAANEESRRGVREQQEEGG